MRILRNKKKTATIALVLVLTIAATLTTFTLVAVAQGKIETVAYLAVSPKIVGLGQYVLINAWVNPPPTQPMASWWLTPPPYEGYMYYFTKPDETVDTVGPRTSDGPGSDWFTYVPDKVGTWTVKFSWAGDANHTACESPNVQFTVQQEAPPGYPAAELPTEYWEYPINLENREWWQISGDWLVSCFSGSYNASGACFNPYSKAPNSAHILWKKSMGLAGVVGGDTGVYATAAAGNPVTMLGRVYYIYGGKMHCADMRTGEELWATPCGWAWGTSVQPAPSPSVWATGWSGDLYKFDAFTGEVLESFPERYDWNGAAPYGLELVAGGAEAYFYVPIWYDGNPANRSVVKWDANGGGSTFEDNIVWETNAPSCSWGAFVLGDVVVTIGDTYAYALDGMVHGFDKETGEQLWNITQPHFEEAQCLAYGKLFGNNMHDRRMYAYNVDTGQEAWASEQADYPWGAFFAYGMGSAYGKVYAGSYDGHVYCWNAETGAVEWKFYSGDTAETPYGTWAFWSNPAIADGKVYQCTGEHSPTMPPTRGNRLYCLDANDGTEIWSIAQMSDGSGSLSIGEGKLLSSNFYDGALYCFDRGQTATTVSVGSKIVASGSSTVIEGTVLDQSPAQPGTPCVSKESMTAWMEYLHMQKPLPGGLYNVTGVSVQLIAVRSDGTTIDIGTVTTDCQGHFSHMWTPPDDEETYTITASFAGDDSYWSSWAETALGVVAVPEPTPTEEAPAYTTIDLAIIAAVVVAIVIGLVNLYALRKRA